MEKGTTHEGHLTRYFHRLGRGVQPVVIESARAVEEAFFAGHCRAYTADASRLAGVLTHAADRAGDYVILPERISKEPLAPAVRGGDEEWATLVRWVRHVLVLAEDDGVTRSSVGTIPGQPPSDAARRLVSDKDARGAQVLGVRADLARNVIKAVGNYREMYERNLGPGSPSRWSAGPTACGRAAACFTRRHSTEGDA